MALFSTCRLAGMESTCTWNVTTRCAPLAMLPIATPTGDSTPGCGTPSTVKLPATKLVCAGTGSLKTTLFAVELPLFCSVMV